MFWSSYSNDCWQLDEINFRCQTIHEIHDFPQALSSCRFSAVQHIHSPYRNGVDRFGMQGSLREHRIPLVIRRWTNDNRSSHILGIQSRQKQKKQRPVTADLGTTKEIVSIRKEAIKLIRESTRLRELMAENKL